METSERMFHHRETPYHQLVFLLTWWRHQVETFSASLAICAGNSPVTGEFPAQRPVTRSFDVFFDLRLNKLLSKPSWGRWFETLLHPLWRHRNAEKNSGDHSHRFQRWQCWFVLYWCKGRCPPQYNRTCSISPQMCLLSVFSTGLEKGEPSLYDQTKKDGLCLQELSFADSA